MNHNLPAPKTITIEIPIASCQDHVRARLVQESTEPLIRIRIGVNLDAVGAVTPDAARALVAELQSCLNSL